MPMAKKIFCVSHKWQKRQVSPWLVIHGRTREDKYLGSASYELIKEVKIFFTIPVIVNGDIDSPQKAKQVYEQTGADGIMIGRAGQGQLWIFRDIAHYLKTSEILPSPTMDELKEIVLSHLKRFMFYGEYWGVVSLVNILFGIPQALPILMRFAKPCMKKIPPLGSLTWLRSFKDCGIWLKPPL